MGRPEHNIHILVFSNKDEEKSRYNRIITNINAIKNTLPRSLKLSYKECRQEREDNLEQYFDTADIILLLISPLFVGSQHYPKEIELAFKKHRQRVKVIPILLSPVGWEESRLGELKSLPNDGIPMSKWSSVHDAANNISEGLREVIMEIFKKWGYVEESDEDNNEANDIPVSSTAFNLTDSILPFYYLAFSSKGQEAEMSRQFRLRMLMRIFNEHRKVSYLPLSEQEVYERAQKKIAYDYTLQDCKNDLKYLVDHYNISYIDDMSGIALSISSFTALIQNKFYGATSDGLGIERLIEERLKSRGGRLSKNDLADVKRHLEEIDEYLKKSELQQDDLRDLEDKWASVFGMWEKFTVDSGDYFSTLERNAQSGQYDFDKYMEYKNMVTVYVQDFADILMDVTHEINELFSSWSPKRELLIRNVAQGKYKRNSDLQQKQSLEETVELVRSQVTELEIWFKEQAHRVCERAASEIHRIVNRAARLALYQRSHVNNITELTELASKLMRVTDSESAQQIFDAAFGHVLPLHLTESLAGDVQIHEQPERAPSVWDVPAPAQLSLGPARRKNASANTGTNGCKLDDPVDENPQELYALLAQEKQKEKDHSECFNRLFAECTLDLSLRLSINPLDRALLEEIIDSCLSHPNGLGHDEMGNAVLLLNPDEQTYMYLCSHDGLLFLPCYQLQLQNPI